MKNTFAIGVITIILVSIFMTIIFNVTVALMTFFVGLVTFLAVLGIFSVASTR